MWISVWKHWLLLCLPLIEHGSRQMAGHTISTPYQSVLQVIWDRNSRRMSLIRLQMTPPREPRPIALDSINFAPRIVLFAAILDWKLSS
jgi:hypothetical protein